MKTGVIIYDFFKTGWILNIFVAGNERQKMENKKIIYDEGRGSKRARSRLHEAER